MARPLPARSVPAPAAVMAACSHGVQPRQQPAPSLHLPRLRPQRASAAPRAPVAALVRSGSIPPARSITAPVTVGMARPNTAVTCPRRRPKRRAPGRTTGKLAPHKAAEALVEGTNAARGRRTLSARGRTGEAHRDIPRGLVRFWAKGIDVNFANNALLQILPTFGSCI